MNSANNTATGSQESNAGNGDGNAQPAWAHANYTLVEMLNNVMNDLPVEDIFDPFVRPLRKNTNFPNFPPGFSPFNDERDPDADPDAYPPPARKPFRELVGRIRDLILTGGPVSLVQTHILPLWGRTPEIPKAIGLSLSALASPIYLWVAIVETRRHYTGWLYYLFHFISGSQGYEQRTNECLRVLREGPNRRFTIDEQFWHRRGCEGTADGVSMHGQLTKRVRILPTVC